MLEAGFKDVSTSYNRDGELCRGVWLSDRVMGREDFSGLIGDVLAVEIPEDVAAPFEWPDDEGHASNWRGFLVPAAILNDYPADRLGR